MRTLFRSLIVLYASGCLFFSGCGGGPRLNEVTGKVMLDGAVPNGVLEVIFEPVVSGTGTAYGSTAADGSYVLHFPGGKTGAPVGDYRVSIDVMPDSTPEGQKPIVIPAKYNKKTELKATVTGKKEEKFDFDLKLK